MTHRSRSGGPQRKKPGGKKKGPKLHHPPARAAGAPPTQPKDDGEGDEDGDTPAGIPSSKWFTTSPSDAEILDVLHSALRTTLDAPEFPAQVQQVKGLLYDRRWLDVFKDPSLLDAYAGRWVPPRTLCFRDLLAGLGAVREMFAATGTVGESEGEEAADDSDEGDDDEEDVNDESADRKGDDDDASAKSEQDEAGEGDTRSDTEPLHILSLGGGAGSECLAVAALAGRSGARVRWTGVDIGAWGGVLERMEAAARDKWDIDGVEFVFIEGDLLSPSSEPATAMPDAVPAPSPAFARYPALARVPAPRITTLFFTLTELLTQSRAGTVRLLQALTSATPRGGLLVVADSASDIADFPLGKDGNRWPVYMVLDHIMGAISRSESGGEGGWEKVRAAASTWYRLDPALAWPCKLENTRYWMRMYRRT